MSKKNNLVMGLIIARAGSKGVKDKHLRLIKDRTVIEYTFDHALNSNNLDIIAFSTDSGKMIELAVSKHKNIIPIERPAEYANDLAPVTPAIFHALKYIEENLNCNIDIIILLQGNIPIRNKGIVDKTIDLIKNQQIPAVRTVFEDHLANPSYALIKSDNEYLRPLNNIKDVPIRRQDMQKIFYCNGSVIGIKKSKLLETCGDDIFKPIFWGDTFYPLLESKYDTFEIDTGEDFNFIKFLIENNYK